MCVAVWAERGAFQSNTFEPISGVEIQHITEFLTYDFDAKKLEIPLLIAARVSAEDPVFIHCVHRRHVEMKSITKDMLDLPGTCGWISKLLSLIAVESQAESNGSHSVLLRKVNGETLSMVLNPHVGFARDNYMSVQTDQQPRVPFTSGCFGPLPRGDKPYLLGMLITIEGCAFRRLIATTNNWVGTYTYAIEGPDVVARNIEPFDLAGAPPEILGAYMPPYEKGISKLLLDVPSYDVVTCDAVEPGTNGRYHDRFIAGVKKYEQDRNVRVGENDFLVNSWHAEGADFLIQKVTFRRR